jgi:hypothetical protein
MFNPLHANYKSYQAYNRTGRTPLDDIITLCRRCHERSHGRKFKWRYRYSRKVQRQAVGLVFILGALYLLMR